MYVGNIFSAIINMNEYFKNTHISCVTNWYDSFISKKKQQLSAITLFIEILFESFKLMNEFYCFNSTNWKKKLSLIPVSSDAIDSVDAIWWIFFNTSSIGCSFNTSRTTWPHCFLKGKKNQYLLKIVDK